MRTVKRLVGPAILLLTGSGMLALSWQKWADALIDFGRELYIPWQINQGSVLYRDLIHLFGPLSHYSNAALFRLFGTGIATLAAFNVVLIVVLTASIYCIFLKNFNRFSATAAGITFLSIFAFSQYTYVANYNFVCPYCHEITYGVVLSFLSILAFMQYVKKRNAFWLFIVGIVLGAVVLTKMEVFLAILSAIAFGGLSLIVIERPRLKTVAWLLSLITAGFLIPIGCFSLFFAKYMPLSKAINSVFMQYRIMFSSNIPSNNFYGKISGIDNLPGNLAAMALVASFYFLVFAVFFLVAYFMNRIYDARSKKIYAFLAILTVIFLTPVIYNITPWYEIARPMPVFMLAFGIYLYRVLLKRCDSSEERGKAVSRIVVTVFALMLLLKMIFNVHVYHYGFALSMPSSLLLVVIITYYVPRWIGRSTGGYGLIRTLGLILVLVCIVWYEADSLETYQLKTYQCGSGPDTIMEFPPHIWSKGRYMDLTVKRLKEITKPDDTLVALPEGVILNYMTRRKNPTPYIAEFAPPIIRELGEENIINGMIKYAPDYIAIVGRDMSEHGYRYFGTDYGRKLYSWIKENYTPVCTIGEEPLTGDGFGVTIMKRSVSDDEIALTFPSDCAILSCQSSDVAQD